VYRSVPDLFSEEFGNRFREAVRRESRGKRPRDLSHFHWQMKSQKVRRASLGMPPLDATIATSFKKTINQYYNDSPIDIIGPKYRQKFQEFLAMDNVLRGRGDVNYAHLFATNNDEFIQRFFEFKKNRGFPAKIGDLKYHLDGTKKALNMISDVVKKSTFHSQLGRPLSKQVAKQLLRSSDKFVLPLVIPFVLLSGAGASYAGYKGYLALEESSGWLEAAGAEDVLSNAPDFHQLVSQDRGEELDVMVNSTADGNQSVPMFLKSIRVFLINQALAQFESVEHDQVQYVLATNVCLPTAEPKKEQCS
ncbi:MAG: hypothetical protein OXC40_06360, partial [Proteobacteria bacterium]|nr:hypothetical protein [Pseudomonadota bacterium]